MVEKKYTKRLGETEEKLTPPSVLTRESWGGDV